jgi:hypothetical protein
MALPYRPRNLRVQSAARQPGLRWLRMPRPAGLGTRSGQSACKSETLPKLVGRRNATSAKPATARWRSYRADCKNSQAIVVHAGPLQSAGGTVTILNVGLPRGSLIQGADTALPSHASADCAARLAYGRPCNAYTVDSCPARTTSDSYLCHHVVRQGKRRRCHALRRCCNR